MAQPDMTPAGLKAEALQVWSPGQTWFAWCSVTGTAVTMADSAWASWNSSVTNATGSLAYSYPAGTAWVSTGSTWAAWNSACEESAEQKAERENAAVALRERQAKREADREAARERATELLMALLTDEQQASYREKGWFEVRGSKGGRWRIRNRGQSGNVDLMPEIGEEREATYCAHPPGLPDPDAHLAQMLALVTDEEAFVRTANVHWTRQRAA